MAKKTIVLPVAVKVENPVPQPFRLDFDGRVIEGFYQVKTASPGDPITMEEEDANAALLEFGGEEVTNTREAATPAAAAKPN